VTTGGRELAADAVVLGIGVTPDVTLAKAAGLAIADSGGIACTQTLETSAPGVYAAGDNCDYDSVVHGRRLRVEHWEHARAQGGHVGRVIAGGAQPFTEIPYFWSDLADWATLEYVGPASHWEDEVIRGSIDDGEFTIFYLARGTVMGALTVGRSDDLERARELMTRDEPVTADEI
jgi:3-phenylpropionate/trans-cinnamate dioxygenase ferredoxin reductase subunit